MAALLGGGPSYHDMICMRFAASALRCNDRLVASIPTLRNRAPAQQHAPGGCWPLARAHMGTTGGQQMVKTNEEEGQVAGPAAPLGAVCIDLLRDKAAGWGGESAHVFDPECQRQQPVAVHSVPAASGTKQADPKP